MPTNPQLNACPDARIPADIGTAIVEIASALYSLVFPRVQPVAWNNAALQESICFVLGFYANSHLAAVPGAQTHEWYYERCSAAGMVMDIAQKAVLLTAQSNGTLNHAGHPAPPLQLALRNGVQTLMQKPPVLKTLQNLRGAGYKAILFGQPIDPNQVGGPVWSVALAPYVLGSEEPYVYTIQFGNVPTAPGSAWVTTVSCTLPATLDPTTLVPGLVAFEQGEPSPGVLFSATATPSPWSITLDGGQVKFEFVQSPAAGNVLTWTLSGNLAPGNIGSVEFSIYPVGGASVPGAASLLQDAVTVTFGDNAPMPTNAWP